MVGADRFELSTSWSQTKRAADLRYAPATGSIPEMGLKVKKKSGAHPQPRVRPDRQVPGLGRVVSEYERQVDVVVGRRLDVEEDDHPVAQRTGVVKDAIPDLNGDRRLQGG